MADQILQEDLRLNRLDLPAQTVERHPMNPRQQAPVAPLLRPVGRAEATAEDDPFSFQGDQRGLGLRLGQAQHLRQPLGPNRPRAVHPPADHFDPGLGSIELHIQRRRQLDRRFGTGARQAGPQHRPAFGGSPEQPAIREAGARDSAGGQQRVEPGLRPVADFLGQQGDECQQCVVQLFGVARQRPGFGADLGDGLGIELGQVPRGERQPPPRGHRPGAALLQRSVIQEGVRIGVEQLMRERARLAGVAGDELDLPLLLTLQHVQPAGQVGPLVFAIPHRLPDQRVIGNGQVAGMILQAAGVGGKDRGQQVVTAEPLQLRRNPLAAVVATHGQRVGHVPTPTGLEQRGRQQSLFVQVLRVAGIEHAEQIIDRDAVIRPHREHDAVVVGTGLQFEVKAAAESLAERQSPGPVDSRPPRGMNHQLHAARLVEEPLKDDPLERRNQAECRSLGRDVKGRLPGRPWLTTAGLFKIRLRFREVGLLGDVVQIQQAIRCGDYFCQCADGWLGIRVATVGPLLADHHSTALCRASVGQGFQHRSDQVGDFFPQ